VSRARLRDLDGQDPYELLGVDRTADHDTIVSAYRRRIRAVHPDLPTGSEEETRLLHVARDILLDPLQRAEYDRSVSTAGPPGDPPARPATAGYPPPPRSPYPPPAPVATNLAASVVSLFFFWPMGIPAVLLATRAGNAVKAGDPVAAWRAATDSRRWSRLAFIIGGVGYGLLLLCCCVGYLLPALTVSSVTR
jgi:hypothetical protein